MKNFTVYIDLLKRLPLLLALLWSTGAQAQFGSDLGDEAISTLAWDQIESQVNASNTAATIGLTTDGRMFLWGGNAGYTIHSTTSIGYTGTNGGPQLQMAPYHVPSPTGETIVKVDIIGNVAVTYVSSYVALSASGKLYAWGVNTGLFRTQWPVVSSPIPTTDSTKAVRTPVLLTVLPETSFVDFDASGRGNYWVAVSTTGKAYHIGTSSVSAVSTVFTALPNPAGVDPGTFKYTRVWVCDHEEGAAPIIYLKANNGKVYYTGRHSGAWACGVPSIVPYTGTSTTSNEAVGAVLLIAPLEVPFPAGEDIVDMKIGVVNNAFRKANVYAVSASGKGYLAGCWRAFPTSGTGNPNNYYTIAPLASAIPSADIHRTTASSDSLYILRRFKEIAMPPGATKLLDVHYTDHEINTGTLAFFDNNRAYWSGFNGGSSPKVGWQGNYLSLDANDGRLVEYCSDVGYVSSNTFYNWTYEAINFKGAAKVSRVAETGYEGFFIISKSGRGYFLGEHAAHAGLGKMSAATNGLAGARVFYPTPIANEQLLSCQTSPGTGGPLTAGPTAPTNTAVGTIDCPKTRLVTAPVAGTAQDISLVVSIDVTTVGSFTPITVTGSGMSVVAGFSSVTAAATGVQDFVIPLHYDGGALGSFEFTIGSAGTCTVDLSGMNDKKTVNIDIWTLDNCTLQPAAPDLK